MGAAITILSNGQIYYNPTNASQIQALAQGQTAVDSFTYEVRSSTGVISTATVYVTIVGADDAPILAADLSAPHTLSEQPAVTGNSVVDTATGAVTFSDVDLADTHKVSTQLTTATWSGASASCGFDVPASVLSALKGALTTSLADSTTTGAGKIGFTLSLPDADTDFLAQGETLKVAYNITVTDNHGASSTQAITFTITGSNDAPVVTGASVDGGGNTDSGLWSWAPVEYGSINFTDADLRDTHSASATMLSASSSAGALSSAVSASLSTALTTKVVADTTGGGTGEAAWGFALPASLAHLATGQTLMAEYQVAVTDPYGAAASQMVTILIQGGASGANVLAGVANASLTESAGSTGGAALDQASGAMQVSGMLQGTVTSTTSSVAFTSWSGGSVVPQATLAALSSALSVSAPSGLALNEASANWTFGLADHYADFLGAGETLTIVYDVVATNWLGLKTSQLVTITLTGANDAPVLSADAVATHALTEVPGATAGPATDTAVATLGFTDADLSDTHAATYALTSAVWSGGAALPAGLQTSLASALTLAETDSTGTGAGSVKASFALADKLADFLAAGETLTVVYNVTVTDAHGASSTKPVSFTITGTNDAPVLSADAIATHAMTEVAGVTAGAGVEMAASTLAFTDVDLTDTHAASYAITSAVWSGGAALPSGLQAQLASALTLAETDSTGTGAGSVSASFALVDKLADFLAAGETLTVLYNVTVTDEHGASSTKPVSFTITGTNDAPVLSADAVATHAMTEIAGATASAAIDAASTTLAFADVDLTDTHAASYAMTSALWSGGAALPADLQATLASALTLAETDSTGTGAGSVSASFALADKLADFLGAGETLTIVYNVTVTDAHGASSTQPVSFTLTGTNDAPVLSADTVATHAMAEVAGATASAAIDAASTTLAFADVDLTDTHAASYAMTSAVWSGGAALPADLQATLASALTLAETDSTGTGAGSVSASFALADKLADFLAAGETLTIVYNVTVTDAHGASSTQPVSFTITGTNDTPVLSGDAVATHAMTEVAGVTGGSATESATTTLAFADVDLTDTHAASYAMTSATWSGAAALPAGLQATLASALTLSETDSTGTGAGSVSASFALADKLADFLAAGETLTVIYNVTVADGQGASSTQPVSFTIKGTNDAPVLSVDAVATHAMTEVAGATAGAATETAGTALAFTDVDLTDTHASSYTLASAVWSGGAALPAGLQDTLASALTLAETDSTGTGAGSVAAGFALADKLADFLAAGETLTVIYNVTVTDSQGASSTQPVSFTLTGTNDAPVLSTDAFASHAITEVAGATAGADIDTASTTLAFTDVDLTDTHAASYALTSAVWSGGAAVPSGLQTTLASALTLAETDSTGTGAGSVAASFALADKLADFLAAGETLTVIYNVTVTDSQGASSTQPVSFTLTGTNDTPVLSADAVATHAMTEVAGVSAGTAIDTASTTVGFTDVDLTDTHAASYTVASAVWSGGSVMPAGLQATLASALTLAETDSTGTGVGSVSASFALADKLADFLGAGETLTVVYNVTVTDSQGASSTQPVSFTITGANDAVLNTTAAGSAADVIAETASIGGSSVVHQSAGVISFADGDLTDHHTVAQSAPTFSLSGGTLTSAEQTALTAAGALTLVETDSSGTGAGSVGWTYQIADNALDFLAQGQTLTATYNVGVSDGHGSVAIQPVTITLTGANDAVIDTTAASAATGVIAETAATVGSTAVHQTAGAIGFTDLDLADTHTVAQAAPTFSLSSGTLTSAQITALTAAGALTLSETDSTNTGTGSVGWSYTIADSALDFLGQGQTLTAAYNVTVADGHGSSFVQPVTVTMTGANDAPVLAPPVTATTLTFSDAETLPAGYGGFNWTSTGSYYSSTAAIVDNGSSIYNGWAGKYSSIVSADGSTFNFNSIDVENYTGVGVVQFVGLDNGVVVDSFTVTLGSSYTHVAHAINGITELDINVVSGSYSGDGVANTGWWYADNFSYSKAIGGGYSLHLNEAADTTGSAALDGQSTSVSFTDVDLADTHTVSDVLASAVWSGGGTIPAATLTALQTALTASVAQDSTGTGTGAASFAFSAADSAFDFLAAGETLTVTYNATVTDNNGATSTQPVSVTITGTNDAPVLSADTVATHAITETAGATGGTLVDIASATLGFTDADLTDTHVASYSMASAVWSGGATLPAGLQTTLASALILAETDSTGTGAGSVSASFALADKLADFLAAGETLVLTYNVTVTDEHGASSTKPVSFTLTGTNDAPVLSADTVSSHAMTEIAGVTAGSGIETAAASLGFTDVDLTDTHTAAYALTSAVWSGGSTLPTGLQATLASALTLTETDSTATGSGAVSASFALADKLADFLGAGETLTVAYNVTVTDSHGVSSTQPVSFTLTGANDAVLITTSAASASGAIGEAAGTTGASTADQASGVIGFSDADLTDHHTVVQASPTFTVSSGTLTSAQITALTAAGALTLSETDSTNTGSGSVGWSYKIADSALDFLAQGQTLTATYNVTVADGHGSSFIQPVTVTMTGANDAPMLTAATGLGGATTTFNFDAGTPSSTYANNTYDLIDGAYNFNGFYEISSYYGVGSTGAAYTYSGYATLSSGQNGDISRTDHAEFSAQQLSLQNYYGTTGLSVTFKGYDHGALVATQTIALGTSGYSTVNFGSGFAKVDDVQIFINSSSTSLVFVDNVVVGAAGGGISVAETAGATGASISDTGAVTTPFTDVDLADSHTVSDVFASAVWSGGSTVPPATLAALQTALTASVAQDSTGTGTGAASFAFLAADKAFDFLAAGETLTVTYNATVTDSHGGTSTQPVSVVITGTNDAPVITSPTIAATIIEHASATGSETTGGAIGFTDADLSDSHLVSVVYDGTTGTHGQLGTLSASLGADTTGTGAGGSINWTYSASDAGFQYLSASQTVQETYTVTVADGHGGTASENVVVTLTGTNAAPVIHATGAELISNGEFTSGSSGWTNRTSDDGVEVGGQGTYGVSGFAGNVMELDSDNSLDDVYQTVATTPGGSYTFSFDAAQRAGTSSATNAFYVIWNGTVIDTITPTSTQAQQYTYTVNAAGTTGTVEFKEIVSDGVGGIISDVSLKPNTVATGAVAELSGTTGATTADHVSGTIAFSDVNLADTHTVSDTFAAASWSGGSVPATTLVALQSALTASIAADATGTGTGTVGWAFSTQDATLDFLGQGETLTLTYNVTVNDGHGGTITQPVTFTVTGANDAPIVAAALTTTANVGDAAYAANLLQGASDPDHGETATLSVSGLTYSVNGATATTTAPGGLSLLGSTLTVDPTNAAFASLHQGQSETITVAYNVTDVHGATVAQTETVTIAGVTPLVPPVANTDTATVNTATATTLNVLTNDTDANGYALSLVSASAPSHGTATVNADGTLTYQSAAGYTGADSFHYTESDGHGGTAIGTVNITVQAPPVAQTPTLTVGSNTTIVPTDGSALETAVTLKAGDTVSFDWNFSTSDYLPYKDFAFATVNGTQYLLADIQSVGSYGNTGWQTFTFTAPTAGTYTIGQGVMNDQDQSVNSYLAVDDLKVDGAVVQSFENGLTGSTSTGDVSVATSANGASPTNGAHEASLASDSLSEAQLENFLGLTPGSLAHIAQPTGAEYTQISLPIGVTTAAGAAADDTYVTISGAPVGSVLNHGTYDSVHNLWTVDATDLGGSLTILTPSDYTGTFTLSVTGTSVVYGSDTSATTAAQTVAVTVSAAAVNLTGTASNTTLTGGTLNDTLTSGPGNDTMTGGGGVDTFVFNNTSFGHDSIMDYTPGTDVLQISHNIFGDVNTLLSHASQVADAAASSGYDVLISYDAADTITLHNTLLATLQSHQSDIHIV